jgi:hypothetical protein
MVVAFILSVSFSGHTQYISYYINEEAYQIVLHFKDFFHGLPNYRTEEVMNWLPVTVTAGR